MYLKIEFANGLAPFKCNTKDSITTADGKLENIIPVELKVRPYEGAKVLNHNTAEEALRLYVRALNYMFRGVINYASGEITGIQIAKGHLGEIKKERELISWNALVDKHYTVIYDISENQIVEDMYVADAVKVDLNVQSEKQVSPDFEEDDGVQPVWITDLIEPNPHIVKQNIQGAITVARHLVNTRMMWGMNGYEGLNILDAEGNIIGVEDIESNEDYVLVKLLLLLINKGVHLGIFFIDATNLSDKIIEGFLEVARTYFRDTHIFLYNLGEYSTLNRQTIELPDFVGHKEALNAQIKK